MPTKMTDVRSMLPTRLRGARFATIAQDASYRRYFASGDDSATIRGVLKRLYDASGNTRRSRGSLDRQLEREARSRRALAGARQRRQRAQNAAQAIAPVVQAAESRGQRLANRKARVRALNLIRRRQLAFRAARAPVGRRADKIGPAAEQRVGGPAAGPPRPGPPEVPLAPPGWETRGG